MKIDKFVDDISRKPAKAITYAILLVLVIILVYWLFTNVKSTINSFIDRAKNNNENPVEDDNLTQNPSWYSGSANNLFNAMNGWGTGWSDIKGIFAILQNVDDWNEIKRQYGTRTLEHVGYADVVGNLVTHLQYELDSWEKEHINNELMRIGSADRI
ncbi:MAG: hypothetical protein U0K59_01445 [Bacteroidales bacterium]|nr:hypothetical protein [Bacteroidales bacterium]